MALSDYLFYEESGVRLYCGDARAVLSLLPSGPVQCVVTSPPYWGLRDYGLPPLVWDDPGRCEHVWGAEEPAVGGGGQSDFSTSTLKSDGRPEKGHLTTLNENAKELNRRASSSSGAFCLRCSAWRGSLGLEPTPRLYVQHLVEIFREVRRVLRDDGTVWLNLGDSYAGSWGNYHPNSPPGKHGQRLKETARWNRPAYERQDFLPPTANYPSLKPKNLIGIPWRVAFALQADGWWLRSEIIWSKPNPMPESVTDRPTRSHEYLFLLAKSERYYYGSDAIKEPSVYGPGEGGNPTFGAPGGKAERVYQERVSGKIWNSNGFRNRRTVWEIATEPYPEAHFATFPIALVKPCILASSPAGGVVLDPFSGSGTAVLVAKELGRRAIGIELNPAYNDLAVKRLRQEVLSL